MLFDYAKKVSKKNCPHWIKAMCSLLLREEDILLKKCKDDLKTLHQQQGILLTINGCSPIRFIELLYYYSLEDTEPEFILENEPELEAANILANNFS